MTALAHFPDMDATRNPIVQLTDTNEAMADSRDVAAYFGKLPRDVTRSIENLIPIDPDWGMRSFTRTPYIDRQNGQTYHYYAMTKAGFSMLAMGFTGTRAFHFKLKYIEAFEVMEAELRRRGPAPAFQLPANFADALRLAANQAEEIDRQRSAIATLSPKADALDRIADIDGMVLISVAAKHLQKDVGELFDWLIEHKWIFQRQGSRRYIGFADKIRDGYVKHKYHPVPQVDGSVTHKERAMLTHKGVARLAVIFGKEGA